MVRLRTTVLSPKDLVRPSTSITASGMACSLAAISGLARGLGGHGSDRDRLADTQQLGPARDGLDAEHQLGTLLAGEDHRRRELGLARQERHVGADAIGTAVAMDRHGVAERD